jgi:hypothetical protein
MHVDSNPCKANKAQAIEQQSTALFMAIKSTSSRHLQLQLEGLWVWVCLEATTTTAAAVAKCTICASQWT